MPRWVHRAYAYVMGYFWLPCPVCGREFGGHETGTVTFGGKMACKRHYWNVVPDLGVLLMTDA